MEVGCSPAVSAARFRRPGASIGPLVLTGFGAAWLLAANQGADGSAIGYLTVVAFGMALVVEALRLDRKSLGNSPNDGRRWDTRTRKRFVVVNVLQYAGIAVAFVICTVVGQPDRITGCAITVIGLHFVPLARLFRAPLYYATAVVMTLCGVLSASVGTDASVTTGAFVTGLTLWITAAIILLGWQRRLARNRRI